MTVEVRLDPPLGQAVGYFRHYRVAAWTRDEALAVVSKDVETDDGRVVGFERVKRHWRRRLASEPGVTWRSGRIYFPAGTDGEA